MGIISSWRFVRDGKPAEEVVVSAREWQADLIVIGTHGRSGVSRVVLGSTPNRWCARHRVRWLW
ncbi:MAG: universal stress protein [Acidobacteria bacterium]|nr:universal stress protein [Acidobacteriota bacterium]